jgi:hypothetical protein
VVKLCLENPDKEVKLPSTRDFAEKFGFTMRTITTELMEDMFNGGKARNVKLNMRTEYRN